MDMDVSRDPGKDTMTLKIITTLGHPSIKSGLFGMRDRKLLILHATISIPALSCSEVRLL